MVGAVKRIWLVVAALSIGLLLAANQRSRGAQVSIDLTQWTPPDIGTVSDDPFGQLVRYGHNLFTDTANEIGAQCLGASEAFSGQQSRLPELPLAAWHPALRNAYDRVLGPIPAVRA
jgi:hypothetical protein